MKARVNPFTREVILDNGHERKVVHFNELDEWSSVKFSDGSIYDVHFYYEDTFDMSVYLIESNGQACYEESILSNINIEY